MNDGYRVSWQTTLGGSPPGIVYHNDRRNGARDHGGYDYAITSGVLVSTVRSTRRRRASSTSRRPCSSTSASRFPTDIDGKPLF